MGFLDRFKKKATEVVDDEGDKIGAGLDKAADFVDDKTDRKYDDKLDAGVEKAKDALDSLDGKNDDIPDEVARTEPTTPSTTPQA
jgi:antitoxin protein of toxin-antitoxin system